MKFLIKSLLSEDNRIALMTIRISTIKSTSTRQAKTLLKMSRLTQTI